MESERGMNSSVVASMETEAWYPYFIASYILQSIISTAGNVLTMAAYWTTPQLQTPQNLLIFNLSLVDSLVAFLCLPWMIFSYTEAGLQYISDRKWDCLFWITQSAANITASMVAILALSLERFTAILFPYRYYTLITDRSVRILNTATWVFSFAVSLPPLLDWSPWTPATRCYINLVYYPSYLSFVTLLRISILVGAAIMNICVAVIAAKKSKVGPVTGQCPEGEQGPQQESFNLKLTKMLLTVIGVFYACWAPHIIMTSIYMASKGNVSKAFNMYHDFAKLLIGLNSALNPLIYAKGNADYRAAFRKIMGRLFRVQ